MESRLKPIVNCKKTAANTAISGNREYFGCENYSATSMPCALFTDDYLGFAEADVASQKPRPPANPGRFTPPSTEGPAVTNDGRKRIVFPYILSLVLQEA